MDSEQRPSPIITDIAGVILAGGQSRRYGKNKALVEVGGLLLIERVIRVMGSVFERLMLMTNAPDEYAFLGLPMHEDLVKGRGPLGGIYTALKTMPHEGGFFVACDMPTLNADLIRHMVRIRGDFDAVVPRIAGRMDALHALYTRRCLSAVESLIGASQNQVIRFFDAVSARYVEEEEIRRFDPELRSFFNINDPKELKRFETL
jgi:molybdopterin-guanine dinucleotide biosynthesis protein A